MTGLFLLLALTAMPSAPLTTLPEGLMNPKLYWEDLDGDGHLDIWLQDPTGIIAVWDGGQPDLGFKKLTYDALPFRVRPGRANGSWQPHASGDGLALRFDTTTGWLVDRDYNAFAELRADAEIIQRDALQLLPTDRGYLLLEETCPVHHFAAPPAVKLDRRRLRVTYPVPRWQDLDGDGALDLIGGPVAFERQGYLGLWVAKQNETGWQSDWHYLELEPTLKLRQSAMGDLNGDGFLDLAVVAMPAKDMSLFEELSFLIYLGDGPGSWEATPLQTLKTKQNLWQAGPMEVNERGVFIYYFKGLIRSFFKIDWYRWHPAGYVEPKAKDRKWKLKGGDRAAIFMDYDMNRDGLNDLILADSLGVHGYPRQKSGMPFDPKHQTTLLNWEQDRLKDNFDMFMDEDDVPGEVTSTAALGKNRIVRRRQTAIVSDPVTGDISFWKLNLNLYGVWTLERLGHGQ